VYTRHHVFALAPVLALSWNEECVSPWLLALKAAIANAATLEEIQRLEGALTTGIVPSEFQL
jgi:hypothetical protein